VTEPTSDDAPRVDSPTATHDDSTESGAGCLLRFAWMVGGNALLAGLLVVIVQQQSAILSVVSIAVWIVVGLVVLARYLDVTRYGGSLGDGCTPATLRDVRRFGVSMVAIVGAMWAAAHAL